MKKTFYYNFIQTKEEEEAESSSSSSSSSSSLCKTTRVLVELRDTRAPIPHDVYSFSSPVSSSLPPTMIKKTLTHFEVISGKLILPFLAVFENVLRYWSLGRANRLVVLGHKESVVLYDVTDQANPRKYNDGVFIEMLPNDDYGFSCIDLFKDRSLKGGDEIGLFCDQTADNFQFKLLRTAV